MRIMKSTVFAFTLAGAVATLVLPASAEEQVPPPKLKWSFSGPFGTYDQGQLQRGFKVFKEVCAICHSMSMVAFRNLAEPGGPGFSEAQAAAVAAEAKIQDLDDKGAPTERPGRLADYFPSPFPN
jgi:cytochrome c1